MNIYPWLHIAWKNIPCPLIPLTLYLHEINRREQHESDQSQQQNQQHLLNQLIQSQQQTNEQHDVYFNDESRDEDNDDDDDEDEIMILNQDEHNDDDDDDDDIKQQNESKLSLVGRRQRRTIVNDDMPDLDATEVQYMTYSSLNDTSTSENAPLVNRRRKKRKDKQRQQRQKELRSKKKKEQIKNLAKKKKSIKYKTTTKNKFKQQQPPTKKKKKRPYQQRNNTQNKPGHVMPSLPTSSINPGHVIPSLPTSSTTSSQPIKKDPITLIDLSTDDDNISNVPTPPPIPKITCEVDPYHVPLPNDIIDVGDLKFKDSHGNDIDIRVQDMWNEWRKAKKREDNGFTVRNCPQLRYTRFEIMAKIVKDLYNKKPRIFMFVQANTDMRSCPGFVMRKNASSGSSYYDKVCRYHKIDTWTTYEALCDKWYKKKGRNDNPPSEDKFKDSIHTICRYCKSPIKLKNANRPNAKEMWFHLFAKKCKLTWYPPDAKHNCLSALGIHVLSIITYIYVS